MTPVRLLARPLLASVFVSGGINALRAPKAHGQMAEPVVDKVAEPLGLPEDPELLAQVNGGVMIGAGLLLALGKAPRLASTALAVTLVPTTMAEHRFWEADDDDERDAQRIHFMKNLGLLGGLVLAAVDTEGKPGLAWRAGSAGRKARREARRAGKVAKAEGRRAGTRVTAALPG
ncbi:DoxX family protein [Iamia majanohamensis]|uniref:DoxX family protein n=1 Tax=Iamia majanohamensis TaxID=467976 RepID=A0AAE9Y4X8_9ACTN|nr:DoxX family protein [Iamia majanohamensis]WCO65311.1 DoxX family protein [Iamia majanohamensis]